MTAGVYLTILAIVNIIFAKYARIPFCLWVSGFCTAGAAVSFLT